MASDDRDVFAQVDANLDTNPKIRKAGSFGRQVFEFLLRRNALRGFKGSVPVKFVDPDYLAELLMIHPSDAVTGVTNAVTAELIAIDGDDVRIVGWHESWGKRRKDGAERTREYRKRLKEHGGVTSGDGCDDAPSHVTVGDESDTKRGEEKRRNPDTHTRARERHPDAGRVARRVWDHGAKIRADLVASNVPTPPWPITVGSDHSGWTALLDRVCEQLVDSTPEKAERVCMNRVDVAAAKARADGEGNWFASTSMFTRNSFDTWAHQDPAQFTRKPAKKRAPGDLIGSAKPRNDHPEGTELVPIKELFPR